MKKIILTIIFILSINTSAQTVVDDVYIVNTTINWDKQGSPYIIDHNITFSSSTLNIDNAEIIFENGHLGLFNNSVLNINNSKLTGQHFSSVLSLFNSSLNISKSEIDLSDFLEAYNSNIFISELKSLNNSSKKLFRLYDKSNLSILDSQIENYKGTVLYLLNTGFVNIKNTLFKNNNKVIELYYADSTDINQNDFDANDIAVLSYMYDYDNSNINLEDNYCQRDDKQIYLYEDESNINETNRLIGPFTISKFSKVKNINEDNCCSNIMFLPGIMTSRLYIDGLTQNQLWEPNRNTDVKKLFLNTLGQSIYKVYTKDIIGITNLLFSYKYIDQNVYNDFFKYIKSLKSDKHINDYKLIPYDWRMSVDDILQDSQINIIQSIKDLQKTSKTGKVTIITHSNGGLIAKRLIQELEKQGLSDILDNVIFVAMPEYGTPQAITALLYGHNQSILKGLILKSEVAHDLGVNMSASYNLLPSDKYFQIKNIDKNKIHQSLQSDKDFNQLLFNKSKVFHNDIDNIIYPKNINIYQIIGTGLNTVSDISYKDNEIIPIYDKNGDGTVQDVSNSRYGTTTYIDLKDTSYKHFNIMNHEDVLFNIDKIIKLKNINTYRGLDYNKIIKENNYKLLKITNNVNPYDLEMSIDYNSLYLDKININKNNDFTEVKESLGNRFELYDDSINYLYKNDFDDLKINSRNDNQIDISIIESVGGDIVETDYDNIAIFKDIEMNFDIDNGNVLNLNLPQTGQSIRYEDTVTVNNSSTTEEIINTIISTIKSSSIDNYMKSRYIGRLSLYAKNKDKNYLSNLKNTIIKSIASINSFSHSAALKARYSKMKEGYIFLNLLLLKL